MISVVLTAGMKSINGKRVEDGGGGIPVTISIL